MSFVLQLIFKYTENRPSLYTFIARENEEKMLFSKDNLGSLKKDIFRIPSNAFVGDSMQKTVNCFRKNAPSKTFGRVVNTPLTFESL